MVLAEEYGRWPGCPNLLAVKMVDLTSENSVIFNGRIPISFAAKAGVQETEEVQGSRITVEWEDLEVGIEKGFKVTTALIDPKSEPVIFTKGPTSSMEEDISDSSRSVSISPEFADLDCT